MKKIISFLASLSLLSTTSTMIISCSAIEAIFSNCLDENGNNVTDKDSDQKQWYDLTSMLGVIINLSKEKIPNATAFQEMNNISSNELRNYFNTSKNDDWKFNYDFTFLITNYHDSINKNVISQMRTNELVDKNPGIYLFLNLPTIDINNIENEPEIDFQFLFMIKDPSGKIIGNNNNDWFYWYDSVIITNNSSNNNEYFFNIKEVKLLQKRVVTNFYN